MKAQIHQPRKLGFFAMLLALLGLAGCEGIGVEVMYGSPTAHYSVKGTVTDENGNPIKDLEVRLHGVAEYEGQGISVPNQLAPVRTDQKGTYHLEMSYGRIFPTVQVNVDDVDGSANGGEFASDSLRNSTYAFVKDNEVNSPWHVGTADITMPDIKLKKK